MTPHDALTLLWRGTLISSLAICCVLALRLPARRWLGAQAAYALWLLVPCALLATLLPAPARPLLAALQVAPSLFVGAPATIAAAPQAATIDPQPWLLAVWVAGALILLGILIWQQRRYMRALGPLVVSNDGALRAEGASGSPALVGALFPRIILPVDFEARFDARERELVLAHERAHLGHGDAQVNALVALLRCLQWFNPLFHFAASHLRIDQELACDARVITRFPEARRSYADAMLKAQLVGEARQELRLPAGCYWPSSHPLKERIFMLKAPILSQRRRVLSSAAVLALALSVGYASWAAQPGGGAGAVESSATAGMGDAYISASFKWSIDGKPVADTQDKNSNPQAGVDPQQRWTVTEVPSDDSIVFLKDEAVHVLNRANKPFTVSAKRGNESWVLDGIATPLADGTIDFSSIVKHDDAIVSAPRLTVRNGEPAAILIGEQRPDGFQGLKVDLVLARADAAQAGARQKPQSGKIMLGELKTIEQSSADGTPSENITFRRMKAPKYPVDAIKAGMGADLILKVLIDEQGKAQSATVEKLDLVGEPKPAQDGTIPDRAAIADSFAQVSIAAALSWVYNPGVKNGKPVAGYGLVPINFSTHKCDKDHPCPPSDKAAAKS